MANEFVTVVPAVAVTISFVVFLWRFGRLRRWLVVPAAIWFAFLMAAVAGRMATDALNDLDPAERAVADSAMSSVLSCRQWWPLARFIDVEVEGEDRVIWRCAWTAFPWPVVEGVAERAEGQWRLVPN